MRVNITFRKMEGPDAIKEHVTKKVGRVRKYLQGPVEANVVMSVERHLHQCDVTITAAGWTFKGAEETEDMYTSVDKVMDKIERQIRRRKGQEQARKSPGSSSTRDALEQLEGGRLGVSDQAATEAGEEGPGSTEEGGDEEEERPGS
jgi:putative sigma-54 modulation protein